MQVKDTFDALMNSFSVHLFTPAEFACVCTCQKAKSMFRGIWAGTAVIWNNDNLNTLFSWTIVFAFSHLSLAFSLSVSSFHISWLSSVGRCVCLSPQEDVVDQIPCLRVFKLWFPDTDTIPKKLFKTGLLCMCLIFIYKAVHCLISTLKHIGFEI